MTTILASAGLAWAQPVEREMPLPPGNVTAIRKMPITVGDKTIQAVVADTHPTRVQGLLGWDAITDEDGMLLDFIVQGPYAIHMRGMKFAIDSIWIDSDGVIKLTYESIPPNTPDIYPSMFPCRYCLEVKAGFCKKYGVKAGQKVRFGTGK